MLRTTKFDEFFMRTALTVLLFTTLASCTNMPRAPAVPASPCDISKASYECQIEQYQNVNVE
jgi:hypothetical protein